MPSLKYVCLSDLHLGAEYSILTPVDRNGVFDRESTHSVIEPFADALRGCLAHLAPRSAPTLILNGDVGDFSFASEAVSATVCKRFAAALLANDGRPAFDPRILFLAGNHDHHLWRMAKDERFVRQIAASGQGAVPPLLQTTPLMAEKGVECGFLAEAFRVATGRTDITVENVYPNLGMGDEDRCLVLHHGHFIESLYTAVSRLIASMSDGASLPGNVEDLETENGDWIDYFWSELGSEGAVGYDAVKLYQTLQDAGATRSWSSSAARRLSSMVLARLPAGGMPAVRDLVERLSSALLGAVLGNFVASERYAFECVLSSGTLANLRWYLDVPVRQQLIDALGRVPRELTFVFGHTHKPFEDLLPLSMNPNPVKVFNTGGWVLDETCGPSTQGGGVVFISDELDVAALRLFQASPDGETKPVQVQGARGPRDPTPWVRAVADAVRSTDAQWKRFSAAAYSELALRSQAISARFFDPRGNPYLQQRKAGAST